MARESVTTASDQRSDTSSAAALIHAAREAFEAAERLLESGHTAAIPDETVQQLLTAGTRLFARKVDAEDRYFLPVVSRQAVNATEVCVTVVDLIRAVDLNLFDVSMWASRPRRNDETALPDDPNGSAPR
jgi:hypothetical protein